MKTITSEEFVKVIEERSSEYNKFLNIDTIRSLAYQYDCGVFRNQQIIGNSHYQKAFELYSKGAEQEDPACLYGLAIMYHTGRWSADCVPGNFHLFEKPDEYMKYLKKSAALGFERAIERLEGLPENKMRLFWLERTVDPSGVSGLGRVAEGVIFTNGKVALTWTCGTPTSVAIYEKMEDIETIHGHNGSTKVIYRE